MPSYFLWILSNSWKQRPSRLTYPRHSRDQQQRPHSDWLYKANVRQEVPFPQNTWEKRPLSPFKNPHLTVIYRICTESGTWTLVDIYPLTDFPRSLENRSGIRCDTRYLLAQPQTEQHCPRFPKRREWHYRSTKAMLPSRADGSSRPLANCCMFKPCKKTRNTRAKYISLLSSPVH